jgi:hypothetical protein
MKKYPVSSRVNSVKNDDSQCAQEITLEKARHKAVCSWDNQGSQNSPRLGGICFSSTLAPQGVQSPHHFDHGICTPDSRL